MTADVFHDPIGWLNFVAFQNILFMVCTRDVFHSPWFRHRSNQYYSTTFGGEAISYRLALICQCCVCWMGDQSPTTSVATASCLPYHSQILIVCRKERVKKKPQRPVNSLYFLALSTHGNGWLHLTDSDCGGCQRHPPAASPGNGAETERSPVMASLGEMPPTQLGERRRAGEETWREEKGRSFGASELRGN